MIKSKSNLYDIIDNLCSKEGINIAGLCRETGLRPGLLSDLKSGKSSSLSMDSLRRIADFFCIPMDALFDRKV